MLVSAVVTILLGVGLLVLPGAAVSFGLLRDVPRSVRWALAVSFSPAVVALEAVLLSLLKLPFGTAVWIMALGGLLSLVPIALEYRRKEAAPERWGSLGGWTAAAIAILAAAIVPLLLLPGLRIFGWHQMMQLSAIEQIWRLPAVPEEMDLAGMRLNYAWAGHVSIAAISWLVGRTVTTFYFAVNVLLLASTFVPLAALVRRMQPSRATIAVLGLAAAWLSLGLLSMLGSFLPMREMFVTEYRPIPLIAKLPFQDAMNVGVALSAGLIWSSAHSIDAPLRGSWLHPGLFVFAIGICYPLLFPAAFLLSGVSLAVRWLWRDRASGRYRETLLTGGALVAAVALCLAHTRFLQAGRHVSVIALEPRSILHGGKAALLMFAPWLLVLVPIGLRAWKQKDIARTALLAGGAVNLAAFVLLAMPAGVQYKFVFATGLCWSVLMAEWLATLLGESRRGLMLALGTTLFCAALSASFLRRVHPPNWSLERVRLSEQEPAPRATQPELAWLNVVRDNTPRDTVMIFAGSFVPAAVLADRSSFIESNEHDQDRLSWRVGYSMAVEVGLIGIKAYPRELFEERQRIVSAILADDGGTVDATTITGKLLELGRPVAIHARSSSAYVRWLQANGIGRSLDGAGARDPSHDLLWYIVPEDLKRALALKK